MLLHAANMRRGYSLIMQTFFLRLVNLRSLLASLLCLVTLVASLCTQTALAAGPVQIELRIYSGRANPTWTVDESTQVASLAEKIDSLPSAALAPAGVGSFAVLFAADNAGPPRTVIVSNGIVVFVKADGSQEAHLDAKGLRNTLINSALEHGVVLLGVMQGDLNADGRIDQADIDLLLKDRGKRVVDSACGTRCDFDGDGVITAQDARRLTLLCTYPRCKSNP